VGLARRVGTFVRARVRVLCGPAREGGGEEGGKGCTRLKLRWRRRRRRLQRLQQPRRLLAPPPGLSGFPFPRRGPEGRWMAGEA